MAKLKSSEDISKLREAGRLAANTLRYVGSFVRPGISTEELDKITYDYILSHGAYPSPLNYHGYPKSICTSVNDVICHGIPNADHILKEGDIINIDVTVTLNEYFGDCSRTYFVGDNIPPERVKLTKTTEESLAKAIVMARHGNRIGDIGHAIQTYDKWRRLAF